MSKGVSSASPCEPVTCLVQPRRPGASRPATTQRQVSSCRRQPREPWDDGKSPHPSARPPPPQPGCPRRGRAAMPASREKSLTGLTSGAVGTGRARSLAGWRRWLWRRDLRRRHGVRSRQPGTGTQPCRGSREAPDLVKVQHKGSRRPKVVTAPSQNHRITECSGLEGTSVGHLVQPPAEAGSPRAGCTSWLPNPCPWPRRGAGVRFSTHLLHRAGCTALAAVSTRGGGGGGVWRAGAGTARCGAGPCSSLPRQLLQHCYSSRRLPQRRNHCGPAPERSSHLSGEEKADAH